MTAEQLKVKAKPPAPTAPWKGRELLCPHPSLLPSPVSLAHGGVLPCELQSLYNFLSFDLYKMTLQLQRAIDLIKEKVPWRLRPQTQTNPTPPWDCWCLHCTLRANWRWEGIINLSPYEAKYTRQQPSKSSPVECLITTFCNLAASLLESFKVTTNQPFPMHNVI